VDRRLAVELTICVEKCYVLSVSKLTPDNLPANGTTPPLISSCCDLGITVTLALDLISFGALHVHNNVVKDTLLFYIQKTDFPPHTYLVT